MIPLSIVNIQLKHLNFGDVRLNKRMRKCVQQIIEVGANLSFPNIFKDQYGLKAFYRLINNMKVSALDLYKSYQKGLTELIQQNESSPTYQKLYAYSDSTFGKYNGRKGLELGYIETPNDNGCLIHTSILTDKNFVPLGVLSQQIITRSLDDFGKSQQRYSKKIEEKESSKWILPIEDSISLVEQTEAELIHFSDREGDIAEVFNYASNHNQYLVSRANHNRKLDGHSILLKQFIRQQPLNFKSTRQLLDAQGKPHQVICEIRYAEVEVSQVDTPLWIIHLKAIAAVQPDSKIMKELEETEWFLLSNYPVENDETTEELINAYTHRWRTCEDFHKCLKTGCSIEKRQFEDLKSISTVIAMMSLAAVYLLRMRHLAQTEKDTSVTQILNPVAVELSKVLAKQYLKPIDFQFCESETAMWLVLLIGRLGGHQGFKQKGLPGWQTLFKGWKYFQTLLHGINLSKNIFNET